MRKRQTKDNPNHGGQESPCLIPPALIAVGRKNDFRDGKARMDLLPLPELEEVAKVLTAGARKYGDNNWRSLPNGYERYKGALLRHLTAVERGQERDDDTGCLHIAQVAANALFMLHFKLREARDGRHTPAGEAAF